MATSAAARRIDHLRSFEPPEAPLARPFPIVGSIPDVLRFGILDVITRAWHAHGDTFRVRMADAEMLVVVHPDAIERVLGGANDQFVKGTSYDLFRLMFGEGMLTMEGSAWRERRRLAQPSFHRERIQGFAKTMAEITGDALASWRRRVPEGGVLDMHAEMMRLTLEIVCATLFGQRLGEQSTSSSSHAFGEALALISERGSSIPIPLAIPTPTNLRMRRAIRTLDEGVSAIIAKARASAPDSPVRSTLLGMFLDARDDQGNGLDERALRNEVLTMFLAGHETTALLLTWLFTLIGEGDPAMHRMREEVDAVLDGRTPTFEDVPRLVYTRQVIDEVLRLRPPAWTVARDAQYDGELAGVRVRKGHRVLPAILLTHRHPAFWRDPERFDPDRFAPGTSKERHRWSYLPFSMGSRMCIGNQFSLVEATLIIAMITQRLEFSLVGPAPRATAAVTMRPAGPVPVNVRWRSSHSSR